MQFTVILSFLLVVALQAHGQKGWAPVGATWHYDFRESPASPATGCYIMQSVKDTLIESKACRVIEKHLISSLGDKTFKGEEYIYTDESGDKVYRYFNDKFFLLYDFSKQPGDKLVIYEPNRMDETKLDSTMLLVKDTGFFEEAGGSKLRLQKLEQVSNFGSRDLAFNGEVVEGIGNLYYFFPNYGLNCDGGCPQPLRCYADSDLSYSEPRFNTWPCDTVYTSANSIYKSDILIFPNPVNDKLTIKRASASQGKLFIEVFGPNGNKTLYTESADELTIIDFSGFTTGSYLVRITDGEYLYSKVILKRKTQQ